MEAEDKLFEEIAKMTKPLGYASELRIEQLEREVDRLKKEVNRLMEFCRLQADMNSDLIKILKLSL